MLCRFRKSRGAGGGHGGRERGGTYLLPSGRKSWVEEWGFPELEMRPSRVALVQDIQDQLFKGDGSAWVFFLYLLLMSSVPTVPITGLRYLLVRYDRCFLMEDKACCWIFIRFFWLHCNRESVRICLWVYVVGGWGGWGKRGGPGPRLGLRKDQIRVWSSNLHLGYTCFAIHLQSWAESFCSMFDSSHASFTPSFFVFRVRAPTLLT